MCSLAFLIGLTGGTLLFDAPTPAPAVPPPPEQPITAATQPEKAISPIPPRARRAKKPRPAATPQALHQAQSPLSAR
ncbi:exported hypothetical protein [Candidatus Sulfopaludibacter sp. SbA3]|nr:exported hypothetical protein [Candidatus Sulfopaludibacter sp. SbA3]